MEIEGSGRIDDRQAKLPVFAPIVDSVGQALRTGVPAEVAEVPVGTIR
jgi:hypothetical protein